ncbi:hypothetical protein Ancab_029556 [Ancistrocladus abbreviatus]
MERFLMCDDGRTFGFVRFISVKDEKLEQDLNQLWIGIFKLRVSLAMCSRKVVGVKGKNDETFVKSGKEQLRYRTYAEMLSKGRERNLETQEKLKSTWEKPRKNQLRTEGFCNCMVRPIGRGLALSSVSDKELERLVGFGCDWLLWWFELIRPWEKTDVGTETFIWIKSRGVPLDLHGLNLFTKIAPRWGKLISPDKIVKERKHQFIISIAEEVNPDEFHQFSSDYVINDCIDSHPRLKNEIDVSSNGKYITHESPVDCGSSMNTVQLAKDRRQNGDFSGNSVGRNRDSKIPTKSKSKSKKLSINQMLRGTITSWQKKEEGLLVNTRGSKIRLWEVGDFNWATKASVGGVDSENMVRRIEELENHDATVYAQAMTEPLAECGDSDALVEAVPSDDFVAWAVSCAGESTVVGAAVVVAGCAGYATFVGHGAFVVPVFARFCCGWSCWFNGAGAIGGDVSSAVSAAFVAVVAVPGADVAAGCWLLVAGCCDVHGYAGVEFVFVPCPAVRLVVRRRAGSAGGTVFWISFLVVGERGCYLAKCDFGAPGGVATSFVSDASIAGAAADGTEVAVGCCGASGADGVGHCVMALFTCPAVDGYGLVLHGIYIMLSVTDTAFWTRGFLSAQLQLSVEGVSAIAVVTRAAGALICRCSSQGGDLGSR